MTSQIKRNRMIVQLLVCVLLVLDPIAPVFAMSDSVGQETQSSSTDIATETTIGHDPESYGGMESDYVSRLEQTTTTGAPKKQYQVNVEPQILLEDTPVTVSWILKNYELPSSYETKISVPQGLMLADETVAIKTETITLGLDDEIVQEYTLKQKELTGSVELTIKDISKAPFIVTVQIDLGDKEPLTEVVWLDQAQFSMQAGEAYQMTEMGMKQSQNGELNALNGKVNVSFDAKASVTNLAMDIRYPSPNNAPSYTLSGESIEIIAVDTATKRNVTQFDTPFTLVMEYDQDHIYQGTEEDLKIFYFDEATRGWKVVETIVDTEKNILTAQVDHLTVFDYKADSWQGYSIPTVDSFAVSSFTGASTYAVNLWTPPGPGGFQPNLTLSYNSGVVDDSTVFTQASWVGMGWSLDVGYIERNMHGTNDDTDDDTFMLNVAGVGSQLLPISSPTNGIITYATSDQSYMKIEQDTNNDTWTVWDKSGMKYVFDHTSQTHTTEGCINEHGTLDITWRWSLTATTNQHGQTMTYSYTDETKNGSCINQTAVYLDKITYPNGKYLVKFILQDRNDFDNDWKENDRTILFSQKRLDRIEIQIDNDADGTGDTTIRQYDLNYAGASNAIYPGFTWNDTTGAYTSTLESVQELNGAGTVGFPATTFIYDDNVSQHLSKVENGYGGSVEMDYEEWVYFDDYNDDLRSIYIKFGDDNDECPGSGGCYSHAWKDADGAGRVKCEGEMLQIYGGVGTLVMATHEFPEHVIKPSGRYRFFLEARPIFQNTTVDVEFGVRDYTNHIDYQGVLDNAPYPNGSSYEYTEVLNKNLDPNNVSMLVETDQAYLKKIQFMLMPQHYRVTERTVTDSITNESYTIAYSYEGGATNDKSHSAVVNNYYNDKSLFYSTPYREYRGNAMVKQTVTKTEYDSFGNPVDKNMSTITWFHQDDLLKGAAYRTFVGDETFYDAMSVRNTTDWIYSNSGTSFKEVTENIYLKLTNEQNNWDVYAKRQDYSLSDGTMLYTQFYLPSEEVNASTSFELRVNGSSEQFGLRVVPIATGHTIKMKKYIGGPTFVDTGMDFKYDSWYSVMIFIDDDDNFRLRVWEKADPDNYFEGYMEGLHSGIRWSFSTLVKNGSAYVGPLFEGIAQSETITDYETDLQYDSDNSTAAPDICPDAIGGDPCNLVDEFNDLQVVWSYVASTISRTFEGDYSWNGTKTEYTYDLHGNVTKINEYTGTNSHDNEINPPPHFAPYRLTWISYPTSSSNNIYGVPTKKVIYDCRPVTDGMCSVANDEERVRVAVTHMYYDSSKTQTPDDGYLSRTRTWVEGTSYSQVEYNYDSYGNSTSTTQYDEYGTATTNPPQGSEITPSIVTTYDTTYNTYPTTLTYNTLSGSPTITTGYDYNLGLPTSVTDLNGNITYAEYDALGRQTKIIAPGDSSGSPTLQIQYINAITTVGSEKPYQINLQQKVDGSTAIRAGRFYNGFGQMIQTQQVGTLVNGDNRNVVVDITFDIFGNVLTQSIPYDISYSSPPVYYNAGSGQPKAVTNDYDIFGRISAATGVNTVAVSYAYEDLKTSVTDGKGIITNIESDIWGNLTKVDEAMGPDVSYTYDVLGQLTAVSRAGNITSITYDHLGRKLAMSDPDMGDWSYQYDTLGNLVQQTDARGCVTSLTYDELNRLTGKTYSGTCNITTSASTYTYDQGTNGLGLRTSMSDGSGSTTWVYDVRGRLIEENKTITGYDGTFTTGYAYNSADMVTTMTYPDGEQVTTSYSNGGLLTQMSSNLDDNYTYLSGLTYDAAGRLTNLDLGDSDEITTTVTPYIEQAFNYYAWDYSADATLRGLLHENVVTQINGNVIQMHLAYTSYDNNGNILEIENQFHDPSIVDETTTLTYDNLNRLSSMLVEEEGTLDDLHYEAFTYDNATGNMASKLMDTNPQDAVVETPIALIYPTVESTETTETAPPHAVVEYDGNTYGYDANGNQTGRSVDGTNYSLSYDHENRLVSVSVPPQEAQGASSIDPTMTGTPPTATLTGTLSTATLTGTPPTATPSPGVTPQPTHTPETPTLTPTASNTPEPPTETPVPTEAETLTPEHTATGTPSNATATLETSVPPTEPSEPEGDPPTEAPTQTGTLPTLTHTSTGTPPTETPSETPVTETNTPSATLPATAIPTEETPPATLTPSATPVESQTASLTPTHTASATPTGTGTSTLTATLTPTVQESDIPVPLAGVQSTGPIESAIFIYDGDGNMVKSIIDGVSTYYIGGHYEIRKETVEVEDTQTVFMTWIKYYTGPTGRFAMRELIGTYTIASEPTPTPTPNGEVEYLQPLTVISNELYWIFSDHLQSSSVVLEEDGTLYSRTSYTAFGEVRYQSSTSPTDYQYTGQRSYLDDFGLHYYVARWYDPATAHFAQADTIIPNPGNSGDWDRYAYVLNNPMTYIDVNGHFPILAITALIVGGLLFFSTTSDAIDPVPQTPEEQKQEMIQAGIGIGIITVGLMPPVAQVQIGTATLADGDPTNEINAVSEGVSQLGNAILGDDGGAGEVEAVSEGADIIASLPEQVHHMATWCNKKWTPLFEQIVGKYGLKLDDLWNKFPMPHRGSHPNDYHEWVYRNMLSIVSQINGTGVEYQEQFIELFYNNVVKPVLENPLMVRKLFWQ